MAGACYLTQDTPDHPSLFEYDDEVMLVRSSEELIDKTRFLLANPSVRKRMRESSLRRARGEHDWKHRFTAAFRHLGLVPQA